MLAQTNCESTFTGTKSIVHPVPLRKLIAKITALLFRCSDCCISTHTVDLISQRLFYRDVPETSFPGTPHITKVSV